MSEQKKLTPVMQQYADIKAENPDALVLFRLGDFYEVFFDDAKTVSECLGLVLTSRADGIPMCGVPWHAAENYLGRLVRAGYNVALVEQMESPEAAKARGAKQIERAVVRVITPGTLTDENLLSPKTSNFLVAFAPMAQAIAGCDISTGEFFVGKSENIFDDMARINPAEIIYPESDAEMPEIIRLRGAFKTAPVYRKLYEREDIDQIICKVFGQPPAINHEPSAVKLLAGYLFNTQRGANVAFRAPYAWGAHAQLLIDFATWRSLEIDAPIRDGGGCLLDILDQTKTAAGGRRLRSYLRAPICDIGEIRRRQEHIGHLIMNGGALAEWSDLLAHVPDVGRSLSRLLSGRGFPRDLRAAADFILLLRDVKTAGRRLDALMAARFADMNTYDALGAELKSALADKLPTLFRDGGVIRDGFDAALDHQRGLAGGARETIAGLQSEYAAQTGIATLKIKYNNMLGYFIEVPATRAAPLMRVDGGFIHRQTMAGNMRFTTARLIDLDNEVRAGAERAAGLETELIAGFIEQIRMAADDLLAAVELIADADVWHALARCAMDWSWVRPDMTDDAAFDVRGGRHPVIEAALRAHGDGFVKNDCDLRTDPIALITGPNMAGKSTYLRQNAIIAVLAHLGSFVPAASATIGVCDQLFSRVGASDNLAAGQSTFMVEMTETANILRRATNKSFIIFDEIGRGTATYDGMAIAQAVLEFLSGLRPRALFATHYHELTALHLQNTQCLHCEVQEYNCDIVFMHKIVPGTASRSYGIHVAKMAGIPKSVTDRAEQILAGLETPTPPAPSPAPPPPPKTQLSLFS